MLQIQFLFPFYKMFFKKNLIRVEILLDLCYCVKCKKMYKMQLVFRNVCVIFDISFLQVILNSAFITIQSLHLLFLLFICDGCHGI